MKRKIRGDYEKYLFARNRGKILGAKLKVTLCHEVQLMVSNAGMSVPPFDPFAISTVGECKVNVRFSPRKDVGADGSLRVCSDGFLIQIDKVLENSPQRLRSTIAHELMHTFFYDTSMVPPRRLGHDTNAKWHKTMEEEICNRLAREFLVPAFSLRDMIRKNEFLRAASAENVEALKSSYVVSSDIIAFRLIVDLQLWDALFVKYLREGQVFVSGTQMKSKIKGTFRTIMIPRRISPSTEGSIWTQFIGEALSQASKMRQFQSFIELNGRRIRLDAKTDSFLPPTTYIIAALALEELSGNMPSQVKGLSQFAG
jgi:hypothetical protein